MKLGECFVKCMECRRVSEYEEVEIVELDRKK